MMAARNGNCRPKAAWKNVPLQIVIRQPLQVFAAYLVSTHAAITETPKVPKTLAYCSMRGLFLYQTGGGLPSFVTITCGFGRLFANCILRFPEYGGGSWLS